MLTIHFEPTTQINPFRSWVPSWLKVVIAFFILVPILLINGAYIGSNIDISSYLGVMSEDINMAYYASSAGMAVAYLVIPKVKPLATTKTIILVVLLCQVILSLICAKTSYVEVITICSFFIGYFKAFSLVEIINILTPALSPSDTRNEFYAKFYPITLAISQVSLVLTGEMAYLYKWQYMYYFMILLLLVSIVLVVVFMTYARRLIRIPFNDIDWVSLFLVSTCYMCIIYVATYGKTQNWFVSPSILGATILIPISGWMFIRRQFRETPFADLSLLKHRNSVTVYLLSFVLMFFSSFSILTSAYTNSILKLNSTMVNELYLYMIPGFIVGGFICYYGYLKEVRMAWHIFLGFACFTISITILYFRVSPSGLYEDLYIPMFFKGVGMMVLFASLAIYAIYGLSQHQLIFNAFYLISFRSALAPAIGSSILSNWLYRLQREHSVRLGDDLHIQNITAVDSYTQSINTNMLNGYSIEEAQQIATATLNNSVQLQATMLSIREILGWMIIFGFILLVLILLYFFQFKPVKLMKTGSDMSG